MERVFNLADDPDARVRFRAALALGETSDPRAVTALASIARRDSTDRWTRTAVLSSCSQMADRLFVELSSGPVAIGSDDKASSMRELLDSLAAIVGARNRPDEVGRFLDALAARDGKKIDGSLLDEMQTMVLALARGARRSGGRIRCRRRFRAARRRNGREAHPACHNAGKGRADPRDGGAGCDRCFEHDRPRSGRVRSCSSGWQRSSR